MVWIKCYPSRLPLFAVCHALFWLPIGYFVAISYDHVQPVVPYVSVINPFHIPKPVYVVYPYDSITIVPKNLVSQYKLNTTTLKLINENFSRRLSSRKVYVYEFNGLIWCNDNNKSMAMEYHDEEKVPEAN
ncbi:prokaryotic DNA topoisomerase [Schistosoma japonicum]|nr:prokaryotic DNA topoisomerase [Schistosoma japonicum]